MLFVAFIIVLNSTIIPYYKCKSEIKSELKRVPFKIIDVKEEGEILPFYRCEFLSMTEHPMISEVKGVVEVAGRKKGVRITVKLKKKLGVILYLYRDGGYHFSSLERSGGYTTEDIATLMNRDKTLMKMLEDAGVVTFRASGNNIVLYATSLSVNDVFQVLQRTMYYLGLKSE